MINEELANAGNDITETSRPAWPCFLIITMYLEPITRKISDQTSIRTERSAVEYGNERDCENTSSYVSGYGEYVMRKRKVSCSN